jgi:hypothetical protein
MAAGAVVLLGSISAGPLMAEAPPHAARPTDRPAVPSDLGPFDDRSLEPFLDSEQLEAVPVGPEDVAEPIEMVLNSSPIVDELGQSGMRRYPAHNASTEFRAGITERGAGRTIIRAQDRGGRDTAAITKQHRGQRARAISRTIQRAFGPRLDPVARSVDHRLGRAGRGPHHVPEASAQRERARRSL